MKRVLFSQYRAYGAYFDHFALFVDDHLAFSVKLAVPVHFSKCVEMLVKRSYFTEQEVAAMAIAFDQTKQHGTTQKLADLVSAAKQ